MASRLGYDATPPLRLSREDCHASTVLLESGGINDEIVDTQSDQAILCACHKVRQDSKGMNVSAAFVAVHLPQSRFACARLITYSLP